jgi:hypothetical protein
MKTRLIQSLLAVSSLVLLGGCDTEQVATTCRAAGGGTPFAAKYIPTGGSATGACLSPGEDLALSSYDPPGANVPSLAIAVSNITAYPVGGTPAIAVGEFTEQTANEANSTCTAPSLSVLTSDTLSYTFSNVQVYVSAANQGTQMKADLTIADSGEGCSATYQVVGLWPAVHCETNADCGEGSGINPDLFESVSCNADIGACMLNGNEFVKTGGDN